MAETSQPVTLRNRYRVLRRLGAGGAGTVFMVEDLYAGTADQRQQLALKAVFMADEDQPVLETLRNEFGILASLRHPLIARVFDFGRLPRQSGLEGSHDRSGYFFTRELIDGMDLHAHCRALGVAGICGVCQLIAEVLDVLHRSGMVHGDLKPANVIVTADGLPHLIDFGLVRTEGQSIGSSGTIPYLAPEILRGEREDRRADLYSLGITLYRLLTGRLPRSSADVEELARWHRGRGPLLVSAVQDVPEELDRLVARLTHPNPDSRYPTAAEAALALAEVLGVTGGVALPTSQERDPGAGRSARPRLNMARPLAELEDHIRERTRYRRGGQALIALEGEGGAGKSTLLQELAWRCQLDGVEVIRAAYQAGDLRTYAPWIDVMTQVAGVAGIPSPLAALDSPGAGPYSLLQQISAYLDRCTARVPLLLLFDNGEQADAENRAVLRFISHAVTADSALAIVVAHQPDEGVSDDLGRPPRVVLAPLNSADVEQMFQVESDRHDPALAAQIVDITGGNPLFVVKVIEELGRQGWPANPDLAHMVPPQELEEFYTTRLHGFDPTDQVLLEILAVVGRPAGVQLLMEVVSGAPGAERTDQLGAALERLIHGEWLERRADGTLCFRQGHVGRIIYEQIPPGRRRELHNTMTAMLDRARSTDPVERTRQAIGAAQPVLVLQTLDEALAHLKRLCAHRGAIQLCEAALPLLGHHVAQQWRIRQELGELYVAVGDYACARESLILARQGASGDGVHKSTVWLARVHRLVGQTDRALALVDQAEEAASGAAQRVATLVERAENHLRQDAAEPALETVEQALQLLVAEQVVHPERPVDLVTRAELRGQRALALGILDRFEQAKRAWEQALDDARACGDRRVEANLLNRWALTAYREGAMNQVAHRYAAALECARQVGDVERIAAIQFNLASFYLYQGELAASLNHLPRCARLFEAMGAQRNAAAAQANLGYLQHKLGLLEQALATLKQAIASARARGVPTIEALALLTSGLVQGERGRHEQARELVASARRIYSELGLPNEETDALLDLAELELGIRESGRAREALTAALSVTASEVRPDLGIRAAALQARIAAADGADEERAAARTDLRVALDEAQASGSRDLTWQCHAAAVELYDGGGEPGEADQHARSALAILEHMAEDLPPEVQLAYWQKPRRQAIRTRAMPVTMAERFGTPIEELEALGALFAEPDTIRDDRARRPTKPLTVMALPRVVKD